jgi:hypothetical protein
MTELLKEMHGSVHGDLESVEDTLLYHDGKLSMHVIGPDIQNVPFFNKICSLLVCIVMFFVFEIEQTFLPNKLEAKK